MLINEIFNSIDGEGKRAGELTTFIRVCGCNLHCVYCDSKYTWGKDGKEMSIDAICKTIDETGYYNITITGGEPLIYPEIKTLVERLVENHDVNIETNGTIDPVVFFGKELYNNPNLFITMDYKCACSGEEDKMEIDKFYSLTDKDVLKFVVSNIEELNKAEDIMHELTIRHHGENLPTVYFSPVFGKIEPRMIVEFMKEHRLSRHVRVQLQLHKYIWDPQKRGV